MDDSASLTSASLLGRIRAEQNNEDAWREFIERYGPKILGWCRQWKLQQADAEDVTQTVLTTLFRRIRSFDYDLRLTFRGWLRKITKDALSDFFRKRGKKEAAEGGSRILDLFNSLEAREQLEQKISTAFDLELLDEATARVRKRISQQRWKAYQMTAVEGRTGAETSTALGMNVGVVYSAKNKVRTMIKEEIGKLEDAPASHIVGVQ